jgi:RimJ/RimL family protein N-acetyltransferase
MGCHYALLRREFWPWRGWQREIPATVRKILVTLGGSDPDNVTLLVIQGLLQLTAVPCEAIVVVGGSNPHVESLETAVVNTPIHLKQNVHNMPELMAWADVAVAAGGSTSWELAFMGLPTLAVILADNQEKIVQGLEQAGVVVSLGWYHNLTAEQISAEIGRLLQNPAHRQEMSQRGQQLVDGYGAERVIQAMTRQNRLLRARPAVFQDAPSLFQWVNDPLTRQMSFYSEPIPWENHLQWLEKVLATPQRSLLIVEIWQNERWVAAGQVRFDEDGTVSIGLAPELRGKRLALPVLQTAVAFYYTCHPQKQLVAYIKPDNTPSQKIFTQAGFALAGSAEVAGNLCLKFVCDCSDSLELNHEDTKAQR